MSSQYFVITDGDVRMVGWGDPNEPVEASPMVLCPPVLPGEIVDIFCATLREKDPEGKLGIELEKFIQAEIDAAENYDPAKQGLSPGEEFPKESN